MKQCYFFALSFLFIVLQTCDVQAKRKSDLMKWIQTIDNVKSFKKLLRTKTNVLVLFAVNENAAEKHFEVFGETAAKSRGTATLAWIDCGDKEGKKVCKKQKANPSPVIIQHYKDGEYSSDYDRKFTVKSIMAFLKDPKSDGPWEEEDTAVDVVHIESEKQLHKVIKKNKPTLVMFYAPWCGYCKRFKPVFAEAATEVKGQVIMAGIDAENNKDGQSLRETYNITGFPKTVFFNHGKMLFEYSGGHSKQELLDWLDDPQEPKPKEPEVEWSDSENDVVHLTNETFDSFITENSKVMVFFYAPWCGHCKNLKPEWEKAATSLKEEEANEKLAAMDATNYKSYADRYKVTGYPTIIYFEDGAEKYNAGSAFKRTAEGIVDYIKDPKEPPPPEKPWNEVESDIVHLNDSNFKQSVKKKKHVLVMFYAPWCGHCKKAKPEFQNAASQFAEEKKVAFSAVDCTVNREVCETYDVKGYPTFYYLSYGKNPTQYQGGREDDNYVEDNELVENADNLEDDNKENDRFKEDDFVDFILDKMSQNETLVLDKFWKRIPHAGLLYKLTNETWNDFVREHPKVLVTAYSKKCPNCKFVRQQLAECARKIFENWINVQLAVIDSDKFGDSIGRLWTEDQGVPTLLWYEKGIQKFEYIKSREASDLFAFIQNPVKPVSKPSYPDWSMEESAEHIFHYDDQNFEEFARDQEDMMVFFYSPTCRNCYNLRKMFEDSARILDDEKPNVVLTAVNLNNALVTRDKYSIKNFPHFAYFRNGVYKYEFHGKLEVEDIVNFMKKPQYIKPQDAIDLFWGPISNVSLLTVETFDDFIYSHDHVMVMFYTQNCIHCKRFKPSYMEAADILKEKESDGILAALDGELATKYLKKYKVFGFPTLLYFKNGSFSSTLKGKRNVDAVVNFMLGATGEEEVEEKDEDEIKTSRPFQVKVVTPENITDFLGLDGSFIMFYSATCGACKTAMKGFYEASIEASSDYEHYVKFGIFDAVKYRNDVSDYAITGYPTFWYFVDKHKKFKYRGSYTKKAFMDFVNNPREVGEAATHETAKQWISELGNVEHPNIQNFDKFLKKYKTAMVFFYINACKLCLTTIKPEYIKTADALHAEGLTSIKLAAINGGWERDLMKRYDVDSFPTFLLFQNGEMKYQYHGSWKATDLMNFLKNPNEEGAKRFKPSSWQDMSPEEYGRVIHLGNTTYDSFTKKYDKVLIMFHSLYSQKCKQARNIFRKIADNFSETTELGFGAVDCHRQQEQGLVCYHLSVKQFPFFKYYEDGKFVLDVIVDNPDDISKFLTKMISSKDFSSRDEL